MKVTRELEFLLLEQLNRWIYLPAEIEHRQGNVLMRQSDACLLGILLTMLEFTEQMIPILGFLTCCFYTFLASAMYAYDKVSTWWLLLLMYGRDTQVILKWKSSFKHDVSLNDAGTKIKGEVINMA